MPGESLKADGLRPSLTYVAAAHTSVLKAGHPAIVMRRFELEPFLASISKFEINEVILVPPMVIAIIMSGLGGNYSLK